MDFGRLVVCFCVWFVLWFGCGWKLFCFDKLFGYWMVGG